MGLHYLLNCIRRLLNPPQKLLPCGGTVEEVEAKYRDFFKAEAEDLANEARRVRERREAAEPSFPLAEHDLDALLALHASYTPVDPPSEVVEAIDSALERLPDHPPGVAAATAHVKGFILAEARRRLASD